MENATETNEPVEAVIPSPVLYKFTNEVESSNLDNLLAMFYQGVYGNTVGIMQAFNLDTGDEELVLVGVQLDENGKADCYPIAKVFSVEETRRYLAPNGEGGWYDPADRSATEAAKENMRSYDEAVVSN